MSREDVELVRKALEAYEGGDLSAFIGYLSPEMVTYVAPPIPVEGTYHGPEGFLQVTVDWAEGFDDLIVASQEFIDAGDQVVVRALHKSRGAASGAPVQTDVWYVITVRSGKTVRVQIFNDRGPAFETAGLSE